MRTRHQPITTRRRLRDAPIRTKMIVAFLPIVGVIAAFIYLYFPATLERQALAAIEDRAQRIGEMTAFSAAPAVFFEDIAALEEALEVAKQNDDLIYLMVTDPVGKVLSSFRAQRALEASYQSVFAGVGQISDDGRLYKTVAPIMESADHVGTVYLGFSLEQLNADVRRTRSTIFWISVLLFVIGGGIAVWVSAVITGPLRSITQAVDEIARGDFEQRAPVRAEDEVGQLALSFNFMVDQLARAYSTLEELNEDLELQKTELIAAKDQAEEMSRLKSAFLANMSHEIRTPLSGMIGFAQILSEEVQPELQEFTTLIEDSGNRLLHTLNAVLDYARLEADELDLALRRHNVATVVPDAVCLHEALARRKGLELAVDVQAPELWADLDKYALDQIITNLVGNAVKFTERGRIAVAVEGDDEHIQIRVSDTGIGISEVFLPYIFEEFQQESTGASRSHEGTGLGLSITKRLVELMNGTIQVQSVRGRGTTFTITFPRARAARPTGYTIGPGGDIRESLA